MGLDDIVPDDADTSSRGGRTDKKSPGERDDTVVVQGPGEKKKIFEEDDYEKVKKVIAEEMGLVPNKVLNNYTAADRYDVFHEAALIVDSEMDSEENSYAKNRCEICGNATQDFGVELGGIVVCPQHSAAQIRKELDSQ